MSGPRRIYVSSLRAATCFVLLKLAVKGGFPDAEQARGGQLVSRSLAEGAENRTAFQSFQWDQLVHIGKLFSGGVM